MTASTNTAESRAVQIPAIPFSRLVRVEWRKATDTRSARWLIGLAVLATIAVELAPLFATDSIEQVSSNYLSYTTFPLAYLLPVVLILAMTTEWTQRTVLTTFILEPRRSRVIAAKFVVSLLVALAGALVGGIVAAIGLALGNGIGNEIASDLGPATITGFVLFVVVSVGMAAAFGAALHNSAAAIVLFFVLPIVFSVLGSVAKPVGQWIDPGMTFSWLLTADYGSGHTPHIIASVALWVVLPMAAGIVRTARRELT